MSVRIESTPMYIREKETGRLLPVNMIASGADKTLEEIKQFADETAAELKTELEQKGEEVKEQLAESLKFFRFPNATIIGEPLIENGQVSRFSNANYMIFPFVVDVRGKNFEINFCFTTGSDVTTQQNILDSAFGLALAIRNGKGVMALSSNGTNFNLGESVGSITLLPNQTYYAKLEFDGTKYTTKLSQDMITYTEDMRVTSSNGLFPTQMYIGGSPDLFGTGSAHPFKGVINLNECDLIISGLNVWQGMDDAGLSARANVSLSNLDADGEARFEELKNSMKKFVQIKDTEPTDPETKIWLTNSTREIQVPTWEEFEETTSSLSESITDINNSGYVYANHINYAFKDGEIIPKSLNSSTGMHLDSDSTIWISSNALIDITNYIRDRITLVATGMRGYVYYFDSNKKITGSRQTVSETTALIPPTDAAYFRLALRYKSETLSSNIADMISKIKINFLSTQDAGLKEILINDVMHLAGSGTLENKNYDENSVINDFKRDYRNVNSGTWMWMNTSWFFKKSTDGDDIANDLPQFPVPSATALFIKYNLNHAGTFAIYQLYIPSSNQLWYQYISASGTINPWKQIGSNGVVDNHWANKKCYAYGTSMTAYEHKTPDSSNNDNDPNIESGTQKDIYGYLYFLRDMSGMNIVNRGRGGSGIIQSIRTGTDKTDNVKTRCMSLSDGKADADLILLEVLPNDCSVAREKLGMLGNVTDVYSNDGTITDTFLANLADILKYLQENTHAQIVVIMTGRSRRNRTTGDGFVPQGEEVLTRVKWEKATEEMCAMYSVPCINASANSGLGYYREGLNNTDYVVDNVHLSYLGAKNSAEYIWSKLKDIPLWYTNV